MGKTTKTKPAKATPGGKVINNLMSAKDKAEMQINTYSDNVDKAKIAVEQSQQILDVVHLELRKIAKAIRTKGDYNARPIVEDENGILAFSGVTDQSGIYITEKINEDKLVSYRKRLNEMLSQLQDDRLRAGFDLTDARTGFIPKSVKTFLTRVFVLSLIIGLTFTLLGGNSSTSTKVLED